MSVDNGMFGYTNTYMYNPSVTVFDKCIFVQYKKVGTRYISGIASYPQNESVDCHQLELFFETNPSFGMNLDLETHTIKGSLFDYYVYTSFDILHNQHEISKFKKFTSNKEFLEYSKVNNFTEFCFENPRDLYFVVRNPVERFLSGTIQILLSATTDLIIDEKTREEIKFFTKINDRQLKDAMKVFQNAKSDVNALSEIPNKILFPIFEYFIEKKWDLLFQDVHTENYLHHFKRWIHDIKDKNKLKIIDISQFSSDKSKEFIKNLRTDFNDKRSFKLIELFKSSNKKIYEDFLENYAMKNLSFLNYLKTEVQIYSSLVNSKFFVDLSDKK